MEANNSWFVIINPYSGNKAFKRKKQLILDGLKQLNSDYSIHYTEYSKHETLLVEQGIEQGYRKFISVGGGSGVVISAEGLIITNHHVIDDANSVRVIFEDGRMYKAEIIGSDQLTDIGLVKIESIWHFVHRFLTLSKTGRMKFTGVPRDIAYGPRHLGPIGPIFN